MAQNRNDITVEEMQRAFEAYLQHSADYDETHGPFYHPFDEQKTREYWPIDELMRERAEAWFNGKVLVMRTKPGFDTRAHPDAHEVDVSPDGHDQVIGEAVNEVLSYSRELSLRNLNAQIGAGERDERTAVYKLWLDQIMTRHGYKTQKALFIHMLHVTILRRSGLLTFSPSNHDRIDGWSGEGLPKQPDITLPASSTPEEIGAALRLTFSRCLDTYGNKQKAKRK